MDPVPEGSPIRCPACGSTDLAGDTGDQTPIHVGNPGESGYETEYFDWVDLTCRDCGHQWRDENEQPETVSPLQRLLWEDQQR